MLCASARSVKGLETEIAMISKTFCSPTLLRPKALLFWISHKHQESGLLSFYYHEQRPFAPEVLPGLVSQPYICREVRALRASGCPMVCHWAPSSSSELCLLYSASGPHTSEFPREKRKQSEKHCLYLCFYGYYPSPLLLKKQQLFSPSLKMSTSPARSSHITLLSPKRCR